MKKTLFVALVATVALFATSCKNKDSVEAPKALFEYAVNDDLSVTFTNLSQNGETYSWNFGDGQTSAEAAPVHKFAKKGTYTVTLTATNKAGSNNFSNDVLVSITLVKIDGDFSDWNKLIDNKKASYTEMKAGEQYYATYLKKFAVIMDEENIYFMVAYQKDSVKPLDVYIGCSGELAESEEGLGPCTSIWNPVYIDYLVEFGYGDSFETDKAKYNWYDWSYASLFKHDKELGGWNWEAPAPMKKGQNSFTTMSAQVKIDDLYYAECKISRGNFVFKQGVDSIFIGACTNYADDADESIWTDTPTGIAPAAILNELEEVEYQPQLVAKTIKD